MRTPLHLAALFLLTGAAATHAQITNPDTLVAHPPSNPARHRIAPTPTELQWLWQYTDPAPAGRELELLRDPRFSNLLATLKAPQSFWRDGKVPLHEVAHQFFEVTQSDVHGDANRYISFAGCVAHECENQGLLWIDTDPRHPTVIFAATEWTTQGRSPDDPAADFNLWIFPSRNIDPEHPPSNLIDAIARWHAPEIHRIQTAIVVEPDGTPYKVNPASLGAIPDTNDLPASTK